MTELTTVRIATTPVHAKLLVALLEAEGIAAIVEGDGLADEVAVSRRLMNTAGTAVKVRAEDADRAREVLTAVAEAVDDAELEAQALAAAPEDGASPSDRPRATMPHWPFVLLGAFVGGAGVWMARDVIGATAELSPFYDYAGIDGGLRETWRKNHAYYNDLFDSDWDGFYERLVENTPTGTTVSVDEDHDGRFDQHTVRDAAGIEARWRRSATSDLLDQAVIVDQNGKVLQRLRWVVGRGYEVTDG